ncbi:hypothetical protein GCM10011371_21780 [Novosphingobium marinum]|uniref:Endonuclease YncB(Thermonuclease family) n=1 Tax=Novosphingobium marinum TaxID=1514948 RepID=A0A7Z0BWI2_9SPHN|nr:thermonuclease family protein [Novosphingobium marinum]NYH96292.1 endonuclease YncB(thermonuclease family) [Novosphingobium marinum]GGC34047.1 hypothetical protein GCM10011371_21780 [Novosphingobium marinum]
MADPWAAFQDADEWDDFEDAEPKSSQPAPTALPSLGANSIVAARDGDTFKLDSGHNLRVWGVDAPELKQQGWDRQGRPVPIGANALNATSTAIQRGPTTIGEAVGSSYGRPVAPVSVGGIDLGTTLARQGNALAAPEYLDGDPERRSDYMEAERRARQNLLGVHGVLAQTPQAYRADPGHVPDRETIAQFWDTPTPFAGLRPEIEAGYLEVTRTGSADDILAYAKANGFTIDPAETRRFVASRDGGAKVDWRIGYKDKPKPLTDLGDGRPGAVIRGVGDGLLAGALDEAGAAVDAIGLTPGRENVFNSDRRLADIWFNNQQQNASIIGHDDMAHPGYRLGGQLAGGLLVPFGAKARTVPQLFRVGAAYGGAEGFFGTDGELGERAIGGAIGVPVGGAIGAGGGKALEGIAKLAPRVARGLRRNGHDRQSPVPGTTSAESASVPPQMEGYASGGPVSSAHVGDPAAAAGMQRLRGEAARAPSLGPERAVGFDGIPPPPEGYTIDKPGAIGMNGDRQRDYIDVSGPVRPGRLDQPLTDAQRRALAENIAPGDVLPIASNEVAGISEAVAKDAGRFEPAVPVDEMAALDSRVVRAQTGTELPKRGPVDLVTWLRTQGGIRDQGGELTAMGIGNRSRDLDFARGEQRFGQLVRDDGMNLDDAAFRAWEAGYLPGDERPDVNAFLDAIARTHSGAERFFHPDDLAEVAQFEGMRADRISLEEQLAEGPVFNDRSVPAGEQPFPPIKAYEEWPAGGPDFAGNLNLSKLESPQDIARALNMTQRRVGFDAETRNRISHAETERLASELNLTPDKLLARRRGQALNAEEALAARQILAKSGNELVNAARRIRALDDPGDEAFADFRQKWMRHVAIQEQVSGMTAEAGRALQQFRMAADSRAVRGDVLSALVRGGGGKDNLKNAADLLVDAAEASPGVFNALAEKATKPRWQNKLSQWYVNFLLSWPQTHAVNVTSNALTAIAQIPEHMAGAAIGKARQLFPGASIDRVTGSEVGARAFGLIQGAREGARMFAKGLKTGEPSDFASKVEGEEYKAIGGALGEVIRVPTRFLTAEDEFFKGIARRMEINAQAVRIAHQEGLKGDAASRRIAELVADPTDEMFEAALDYGRYLTFQRPLSGFPQDVSNAAQKNIVIRTFLPFIRTPTNLLKFATERSPAAPLLKDWRDDFAAGGARRDMALSKVMLGTGLGAAIYQGAAEGHITGSAPSDPKKARLLYADGWKPYSVRVGDTYYSYKRLDPFSTTLGVAADLATLPEGMSERQKDDKTTLLVASIMGNLASKTWMSGISDVVSALHEPDRYAGNMLERLVGSFLVPNLVAGTARTIDPTYRQTETIGEGLRSRIPGARESLLPRRDVWGREISNEGGVGPDFLSPLWVSKALDDPVNHELMQLDYAPGLPGKSVGGKQLTPEEYDRYLEVSGKLSHQRLTGLVTSPEWSAIDEEGKVKAAKKVVAAARSDARNLLFGDDKASDGDEWDEFEGDSDEWDEFDDPPQRDVLGSLQSAIPGLGVTSGYRTPEYQADMRRRGYTPARNSAHLDGSALDLTPPRGRSLGWLANQVRKVEPDARLLPEGDHLHAVFPNWYGAPALGNARRAGLRNPMAGR